MTEQSPMITQWKALYEQALSFKHLAPWTWTTEEDLFGVRDPQTGNIGYCCVIGSLGEVFGLIVYVGQEGLDGYKKLRSKKREPGSIEGLLLHNGLSLTFDDKQHVQPEDLEIIKQVGLEPDTDNRYPVFKNLKPGYLPWSITADEAVYLTQTLTQALDVCLRLQKYRDLLARYEPGSYLVRTPVIGGNEPAWHDEWVMPSPVESKPLSIQIDELRVQRLKAKNFAQHGVWEFDYAFVEILIKESERPFFPCLLIVTDHATGFIFHNHVAAPDTYPTQFAGGFIEGLEKAGFLPTEILVARDEALLILRPVASRLGITLTRVKACRKVDRARKETAAFLSRH